MKKFLTKALYLSIALYIAGLAGCEVPLEPRAQAPAQGMGRVVVSIGGGPERTIVPASTEFDKITWYVLSFSGPKAVEDRNIGPVGETIELPAGTWTITATGWGGIGNSDVEIAEGSVQVTVADGDSTEAVILLAPIPDGRDGTLSYALTLNDTVYVSEFTISQAEGDPIVITLGPFSGQAPYDASGSRDLPPGEYTAHIRFGHDGKYMGFSEVFHIYSGLTTGIARVINNDDYGTTVTQFDLSGSITPPVAWAVPVTAFTLNSDQYGGSVSWNGNPALFAPNTAYTATVTLTNWTDWTFEGIPPNAFTYSGATVTNSANSGLVAVTFPATDSRAITGVTVTPASPAVFQEGTQQFSAAVAGELNGSSVTPPQTVTWSVSGSQNAGTGITPDGLLTVAADESAGTLTVRATSAVDTTKHGEAEVAVKVQVPPAKIAITIGLNEGGGIVIEGDDGTNAIYRTSSVPQSITLTAAAEWTDVAWHVNGDSTAAGTGNTLTLNADDYPVKIAPHSLTFQGKKGGVLYSQTITFTVSY